jgi:NitT/TauT family transport system substrate-binding protein
MKKRGYTEVAYLAHRNISRRQFLRGAAGASGVMLLAACAPSAPASPTAAPTKPAEPAKPAPPPASPAAGASPSPSPSAGPSTLASPAVVASKPSGPLKKVRVGVTGLFLPLASVWVAARKGYYQEEGVDADVVAVPGLQGPQGLLAGNLDFTAGSATDLLLMAERGETMQAIATIEPFLPLALVVRADALERIGAKPSDPLEKRLAAIKGLAVAVSGEGDAPDVVLKLMLREGKLQPTDVRKLVIDNQPAQLAALDQRQIDAIVAGPPLMDRLDHEKSASILVSTNEIPLARDTLHEIVYGMKSWVDAHPDEARGVARAMVKANKFLKEDPSASQFLFETDFKGTPAEVLKISLDKLKPYIPSDAKMTPQQWEGLKRYAMEVGYLTKSVDTTEGMYWTNKYLS